MNFSSSSLMASVFIFVEDEEYVQEMIEGTYVIDGKTITMILDGDDKGTSGILSGDSITTTRGYFGGEIYTKTSNFKF